MILPIDVPNIAPQGNAEHCEYPNCDDEWVYAQLATFDSKLLWQIWYFCRHHSIFVEKDDGILRESD